jgi:Uma2 family endonuclease
MAMTQERVYTVDDIYNLPDGERAELLDGFLFIMAPPNRIHQKIVNRLNQHITNYIDSKGGSCEVYPSPFAVFLDSDEHTYVEPDISVICDTSKLNDKGCNGAPDWVIEIVSPSSVQMDYFKKLFKYQEAGVREYWIVDPIKESVTVYNFVSETMEAYKFTDTIQSGIYEDFAIDFSKIIL